MEKIIQVISALVLFSRYFDEPPKYNIFYPSLQYKILVYSIASGV